MSNAPIETLLPQLAAGAPHTHALGFRFEGVEADGAVLLRVPYRPDLIGDPETGVLAGGLVTALLDHVGGMSVWVALDGYQPIATLDLRVDYMRAAEPGLDLLARARCFRLTRSTAFVRAWAYDRIAEDPVAAAQGAYMLNADARRRTDSAPASGEAR